MNISFKGYEGWFFFFIQSLLTRVYASVCTSIQWSESKSSFIVYESIYRHAAGWIFYMQMQCLRRIKDDVLVTWKEKLRWILLLHPCVHFGFRVLNWFNYMFYIMNVDVIGFYTTSPSLLYLLCHTCVLSLTPYMIKFFNPSKACNFFSLDPTLVNCLKFVLKSAWH